MFAAFFTALAVGFVLVPAMIFFCRRHRWEQALRDQGEVRGLAVLHGAKVHTPTMGGLVIWLATLLGVLPWMHGTVPAFTAICTFTAFGLIGLADDAVKIFSNRSRGISGKNRLLAEAGLAIALFAFLHWFAPELARPLHEIWIPLRAAPLIGPMPSPFTLVFLFLVLAGTANGVNLTDGLDGLAAGCSLLAVVPFAVIASRETSFPGMEELAVLLSSLAGALLAFLWFNAHPAKIFMGDTGSLAIGGLLGSVALLLRQPLLLAIIGGVFVGEVLSVLLQVNYFKFTGGRRIFRMAPIHHHFELGGCPETLVVFRFWIISAGFAAIGCFLYAATAQ
jgi:phospho-N-acetylmuramoyl-pentapeptide-transferase